MLLYSWFNSCNFFFFIFCDLCFIIPNSVWTVCNNAPHKCLRKHGLRCCSVFWGKKATQAVHFQAWGGGFVTFSQTNKKKKPDVKRGRRGQQRPDTGPEGCIWTFSWSSTVPWSLIRNLSGKVAVKLFFFFLKKKKKGRKTQKRLCRAAIDLDKQRDGSRFI